MRMSNVQKIRGLVARAGKTMLAVVLAAALVPAVPASAFASEDESPAAGLAAEDETPAVEPGELYTFGYNNVGQLGYSTTSDRCAFPRMVTSDVASVSLGSSESAYVTTSGDLYTFGWNGDGQLGDGTTTNRPAPVKIASDVASVALSAYHSAYVTNLGDLYMFGQGVSGQLGTGSASDSPVPMKVASDVASVSLGDYHSAYVTTSGDLYTFGNNHYGQLGDGTTVNRLTPVKIASDVVSVSLGGFHSAYVTVSGDLYTFGGNEYGQLGYGVFNNGGVLSSSAPKKIASDVATVSLGGIHSAYVTTSGDLYTFGSNGFFELGDGTATNRTAPVKIASNVVKTSLGNSYSAYITTSNDLYTFGYNNNGQLGDGDTASRSTPVKIASNVASVSLGGSHSAYITGSPQKAPTESLSEADEWIIGEVEKYTSGEMSDAVTRITSAGYSNEVALGKLNDLFQDYGIADVNEGIRYLTQSTSYRLAFDALTTNETYCAYDLYHYLYTTTKGNIARGLLYADGLIFNFEAAAYLDPSTYVKSEYPGVEKNKALLKSIMEAGGSGAGGGSGVQSVLANASSVAGYLQKLLALNGLVSDAEYDQLMSDILACTDETRLQELQEQFVNKLSAQLSASAKDVVYLDGSAVYRLTSASEALGKASKVLSFAGATAKDISGIVNLSAQIDTYTKYDRFLKAIYQTDYVSSDMRMAAWSLHDDIENGYYNRVRAICSDMFGFAQGALHTNQSMVETALSSAGIAVGEGSLYGAFNAATGTLAFGTFVSNIVVDAGDFVRQYAYTLGYAELGALYSIKLQEDATAFKANKSADNAWTFFEDYTMLWQLRYGGEEQYLNSNTVKMYLFASVPTFDYRQKSELVASTKEMLEEKCRFQVPENIEVPASVLYSKKAVIGCPVNIAVLGADGSVIARLEDGVESDVSNEYGRFVVKKDELTGEYVKVVCLNEGVNARIAAQGVDQGVMGIRCAAAGSNQVAVVDNLPVREASGVSFDVAQLAESGQYTVDSDGDGVFETSAQARMQTGEDEPVAVSSLIVSEQALEMAEGDSAILTATVVPENATEQRVTWWSTNEEVATVAGGKVSAVGIGAATIYCASIDNPEIVASCTVEVHEAAHVHVYDGVKRDEAGAWHLYCHSCDSLFAFELGDVNLNGKVNIVDAQVAYDIARAGGTAGGAGGVGDGAGGAAGANAPSGFSSDMVMAADVNCDGAVDASDAFAIQWAAHYGWDVETDQP